MPGSPGQGSGVAEVGEVGGGWGRQEAAEHPPPEREECWSPEPGSRARSKRQLVARPEADAQGLQ